MAKIKKTYSFKNGCISKDKNGRYTLTEVSKDNIENYNLSALLDEILGVDGISLNFGSEDSVPSIND